MLDTWHTLFVLLSLPSTLSISLAVIFPACTTWTISAVGYFDHSTTHSQLLTRPFQNAQPTCHQYNPPSTAFPQTPAPLAPCLRPRTNTPGGTPTPTPFLTRKIRLVPTSFENADAVVLVLPPSAPNAPPPQPFLLVGPALARLRQPQRKLAKGSRIHPYRIVRPSDRRPPTGPSYAQA